VCRGMSSPSGPPLSPTATRPPRPRTSLSGAVALADAVSGSARRLRRDRTRKQLSNTSILVGTFNLGKRMPDATELAEWLPHLGGSHDLVVIGTQENSKKYEAASERDDDDDDDFEAPATPGRLGSSQVHNFSRASSKHQPVNAWDDMCSHRLGSGWFIVARVVLWEMRLNVYVRARLLSCVHSVATASAATGVAGVLGNKGGLVVKLNLGHTSLAFVSCHLAAHPSAAHLASRNAQCREILRATMADMDRGRRLDATHAADHVVWLGDLNYRIEPDALPAHALQVAGALSEAAAFAAASPPAPPALPAPAASPQAAPPPALGERDEHGIAGARAVIALAAARDYSSLLQADQLKTSQLRGDAFVAFDEGEITFQPTYKVERVIGSTFKPSRVPSYTDRVLWKSMPPCEGRLRQTSLRSIEGASSSDHKPVVAQFELTPSVRVVRAPASSIGVVVQLSSLRVEGLGDAHHAHLGEPAPYVCFLTHPPGLLSTAATGQARTSIKRSSTTSWSVEEMPLLQLRTSLAALEHVCLILAVFSSVGFKSQHDPLGVVLVPLRPHSLQHGASVPAVADESYGLQILDYPLVLGHSTRGTGRLSCTATVSGGTAAAAAILEAKRAGVGSKLGVPRGGRVLGALLGWLRKGGSESGGSGAGGEGGGGGGGGGGANAKHVSARDILVEQSLAVVRAVAGDTAADGADPNRSEHPLQFVTRASFSSALVDGDAPIAMLTEELRALEQLRQSVKDAEAREAEAREAEAREAEAREAEAEEVAAEEVQEEAEEEAEREGQEEQALPPLLVDGDAPIGLSVDEIGLLLRMRAIAAQEAAREEAEPEVEEEATAVVKAAGHGAGDTAPPPLASGSESNAASSKVRAFSSSPKHMTTSQLRSALRAEGISYVPDETRESLERSLLQHQQRERQADRKRGD
jgi:hypothetical protein